MERVQVVLQVKAHVENKSYFTKMVTKNKRKADSTTPLIMWVTIIIGALIIIVWYIRVSGIFFVFGGTVEEDLKNIRQELSLACRHETVETFVVFRSKNGFVTYNDSVTCITQTVDEQEIMRCIKTPCNLEEGELNIGNITTMRISKETTNQGFQEPLEIIRIHGE